VTAAHGTRSRYVVDKCRCTECKAANAAYYHEAKKELAPSFINASRARKHIAELRQAGVGKRAISQTAKVSLSTVMKIAAGDVKRIRPATERAIMGVTTRAVADAGLVDAGPTLRVIDQLVARGWTRKGIARAVGKGHENALQINKDRIHAGRARAIAALLDVEPPASYDRWGNQVKRKQVEVADPLPQPAIPVDVALPKLIDEGDTDWMRRGACRVNKAPTWMFFPGRGDSKAVQAAKRVCETCAVSDECLAYALRTMQKVGVWGGLTERERRYLRHGITAVAS
jgi:hypothetical protein